MSPEFIRRYYILRIVSNPKSYGIDNNGYVPLIDLQCALDDKRSEYLDNDLFDKLSSHSQKTIKRDIEKIKFYFGVEILLKRNSGYYINFYDSSEDLKTIYDKTELYLLTKYANEVNKHVTIEKGTLNSAIDFVELVNAIDQKLLVHIIYDGWYDDDEFLTLKDYIQPLHIKEVNKSWYLLGYNEKTGIYPFCLDVRTRELKISSKKAKNEIQFNESDYFKNSIGILKTDIKPELIKIKVVNHHFKYLLNNPIHHSQKVISLPSLPESECLDYKNDAIWGEISVFIEPNYEFLMRILKYNMWVQVVSPQSVVLYVKKHIKTISSYYM